MGNKIRLSIHNKMLISYTAVMILLIIMGVIGIRYVGYVYDNGKDIYEKDLKAVEHLKSLNENVMELDKCTFHLLVELDWDHDESCSEKMDYLVEDNLSLLEAYSKLDVTKEERAYYEKVKVQIAEFHEHIKELVSVKDSINEKEMLILYQSQLLPVQKETHTLIEEAVELAVLNAEKSNQENKSIYNRIIILISSFVLIAVVIFLVISFSMSNQIVSKLQSIQLMAKRISEYNISHDIERIDNDEFGRTVEALNESQFMVRVLLEKIISESDMISDMGEEVYLAIKKSKQRVEMVNVQILEYEKLAEEVETQVKKIVDKNVVSEEEKQALAIMREKLEDAKVVREEARTELNSIATYLEQISITADYQNEIAFGHKEQVQKFKVKETEE